MNITWLGIAAAAVIAIMFIRGYVRGFIKEVVMLLFMIVSLALVWALNPYVSEFLKQNTPVYERVQDASLTICTNALDQYMGNIGNPQNALVDQLPLPQFMKDKILENNTREMYNRLHVKEFPEYVSKYLTLVIMNGISFVVSFILVSIVMHLAIGALNLITKLPILNGINRLIGGCIGGVKGVAFVWIVLVILTICSNTEFGMKGMNLVKQDSFLSLMNENNLFMRFFVNIFRGNI